MTAFQPLTCQCGKVVDRVNGVHVAELAKKTAAHSQIPVLPSSLVSQTPPKEVSSLESCDYGVSHVTRPWCESRDHGVSHVTMVQVM